MQNKRAVSLIVLVISVIVMAILASTVLVYLEDTGIVDKTKQTTKDTNLMQVRELAKVAWNKANAKLDPTLEELQEAVDDAIAQNRVDTSEYNIIVTMDNVYVSRDFAAPIIASTSLAYTDTEVTLNVKAGAADETDYPLTVEYYIKKATAPDEAYSLKEKVLLKSGVENSYTYTSLVSATAYTLKVVVKDINGNSVYSTLNVTTQ